MKRRSFISMTAALSVVGIVGFNIAGEKKFYTIDAKKCDACGTCAEECPEGAISAAKIDGKDVFVIDPEKCTACGVCAEVCPQEGISPDSGDSPEIKGKKKEEGEEPKPKEAKKKKPAEKKKNKTTKYTVK